MMGVGVSGDAKRSGGYFRCFRIRANASKIRHNMQTIHVYQDKMEREQNGYAASGRLQRDKQSMRESESHEW